MSQPQIMFVDDDRDILAMVERYLNIKGYDVVTVDNGIDAVRVVKKQPIDIVFTDYKMPEFNGLELLVTIKKHRPQTEVIIVTGYGSMESAIQAMKFGSYDYLQKPFKLDHLRLIIDRIVEEKKIADKAQLIRKIARERHQYGEIVGICPKMREIYEIIDAIRIENDTVLIQGESGVGKELAARTLHAKSDRKDAPFTRVNCGGFSKDDQTADKIAADFSDALGSIGGGTLYLDEITSLSQHASERLAGLLSAHDSDDLRPRLIAGTACEMDEIISGGAIKNDPFALFKATLIKMPPLRERKEDIPLLFNHFLYEKIHPSAKTRIYGITPAALNILLKYHWPGNLIQLQNVIERAVAMGVENAIDVDDLPAEIRTFGTISQMG